MLDFLGTIATVALTIFIISTLLAFLDVSRQTKIVMAALLGLWVGIATAGSAAGWAALTKPFPIMGLFVVVPLAAAIAATAWPRARAAMLGLPLPLVGMNVGRVFACCSCWLRPRDGCPVHSLIRPAGATSSAASWRCR